MEVEEEEEQTTRKNMKKTDENQTKTWKFYKNGAWTDAPNPPKRTHVWMARLCLFFGFSKGSSETTRKTVFSGGHQKSTPKTPILSRIEKKN